MAVTDAVAGSVAKTISGLSFSLTFVEVVRIAVSVGTIAGMTITDGVIAVAVAVGGVAVANSVGGVTVSAVSVTRFSFRLRLRFCRHHGGQQDDDLGLTRGN